MKIPHKSIGTVKLSPQRHRDRRENTEKMDFIFSPVPFSVQLYVLCVSVVILHFSGSTMPEHIR